MTTIDNVNKEKVRNLILTDESVLADSLYWCYFKDDYYSFCEFLLLKGDDSSSVILEEPYLAELYNKRPDQLVGFSKRLIKEYKLDPVFESLLGCYLNKLGRTEILQGICERFDFLERNQKRLVFNTVKREGCEDVLFKLLPESSFEW